MVSDKSVMEQKICEGQHDEKVNVDRHLKFF